MTKSEATHPGLKKLKEQLQHLSVLNLPKSAKDILKDVLQTLGGVTEGLAGNEEQQRLAALYRVSQALGSSLDLDEVLQQVMDAVISLTDAERGFLMLQNSETGELEMRAGRNMEHKTLAQDDMKVSHTILSTVVATASPVVTTNAQEDPRFSATESVIAFALRSILCVPLLVRGKAIGAIYVDNRAQAGLFSSGDRDLLNALAAQAASTIENARLYTRTDKNLSERLEELENLARVMRELSRQVDLDKVFMTICKAAIESTGASSAWVAAYEEEHNALRIATGLKMGEMIPLDDPIIAGAWEASTAQLFSPEDGKPAYLVTPILIENEPRYVLVLEDSEPFSAESMQFVSRLVDHASVAIEITRSQSEIQQLIEDKADFISTVTHELRLPMTSIFGYTDLLLKGQVGEVNEAQVEFLQVIRSNAERMSSLISDLSDISKMESGRLFIEPVQISLPDTMQDVQNAAQADLESKSQKLKIKMSKKLPQAYGDPKRLNQVFTNLIRNAYAYTAEGGEITVHAKKEKDLVRVRITDNGIGINEQDKQRVFKPFFRSDVEAVRQEQGWGLGLTVAKDLVELMGGEMGVESEAGKGSTFWFTLPTKPQA